jgi:hypothetical protein
MTTAAAATPAVADDKACPGGPDAAGALVGAAVRPVEARADGGEDDWQQRDGDRDADHRDQHAAVAEAAQEGNRHHDEAEQADRHRCAAEHDGPPGGAHRGDDRLLTADAAGTFLPPAHHDQERVVDRDAEADQRDQVLHADRYRRRGGQAPHGQEAGHDRGQRGQQRDDSQERREHEAEHDQCVPGADEGFDEHAQALAAARLRFQRAS